MTRILKTLGLTAVAALAMGAMLASAAQAEPNGVFTAGTTPDTHEPATIVGEQYGELGFAKFNAFVGNPEKGDEITCDEALFTGTDEDGTATELTIEADYIHCQAIQNPGPEEEVNAATVDMNGCDYIFRQPTKITDEEFDYTGKAALTCPHEERIEVKVFGFGNSTNTSHFGLGCTIEVWPNAETTHTEGETTHRVQELSGHVLYKEIENGKDHLTVKADVTSITSAQSGLGCTNEENENGEYRNTVTVKAFDDEPDEGTTEHTEQLDAWISDEEP